MDVSTSDARRMGHQVEGSKTFDRLVRVGLVSYGVVHLLIAWLALQVALGDGEGSMSKSGALHQVAQQPFGKVLLWVLCVGFVALTIWQALDAVMGQPWEDGAKKIAKRVQSAFKAVVFALLAISTFKIATGSGSSGSSTDTWTAKLMNAPAGPWLVGLVGLAIVAYGVWTLVKGWTDKWEKHVDAGSGRQRTVTTAVARAGYTGRAAAFAVTGGLFLWAAVTHDPKKSGGLDAALGKVVEAPMGPLLLALVALGLAAYGVFCFAWAKSFKE